MRELRAVLRGEALQLRREVAYRLRALRWARGDGVAGFSWFAVEAELRRGSLALLRLRGWKARRTISIVRPRGGVLTPSAREFVAMLRARLPAGGAAACHSSLNQTASV